MNYYNRGDNGDRFDNNDIIKEILRLRHERSKLLGYENYAEWRLEDRMAGHPDNALNLLKSVWPFAVSKINDEVKEMQKIASKEMMIEIRTRNSSDMTQFSEV